MPLLLQRFIAVALLLPLVAEPGAAAALADYLKTPTPILRIPARYGRITDAYGVRPESCVLSRESNTATLARDAGPKTQDPRLVVLIQDLHGYPGVQRNIAEILKQLSRHASWVVRRESRTQTVGHTTHDTRLRTGNGYFTVFVEGAYGPFDVSLLRNVQSRWVRRKAVEQFLEEGWLTGGEVAAIESETPLHLWGVDDKSLYLKNLEAFYLASTPSKESLLPLRGEGRSSSPLPHPQHPAWQEYYQIAKQRDIPLALNALNHLELLSQAAVPLHLVALVAGGYHAEGITKILKANHIPYVAVLPAVSSPGESHAYVARLRSMAEAARREAMPLTPLFALWEFVRSEIQRHLAEVRRAVHALERMERQQKDASHRSMEIMAHGAIPSAILPFRERNTDSRRRVLEWLAFGSWILAMLWALSCALDSTGLPGSLRFSDHGWGWFVFAAALSSAADSAGKRDPERRGVTPAQVYEASGAAPLIVTGRFVRDCQVLRIRDPERLWRDIARHLVYLPLQGTVKALEGMPGHVVSIRVEHPELKHLRVYVHQDDEGQIFLLDIFQRKDEERKLRDGIQRVLDLTPGSPEDTEPIRLELIRHMVAIRFDADLAPPAQTPAPLSPERPIPTLDDLARVEDEIRQAIRLARADRWEETVQRIEPLLPEVLRMRAHWGEGSAATRVWQRARALVEYAMQMRHPCFGRDLWGNARESAIAEIRGQMVPMLEEVARVLPELCLEIRCVLAEFEERTFERLAEVMRDITLRYMDEQIAKGGKTASRFSKGAVRQNWPEYVLEATGQKETSAFVKMYAADWACYRAIAGRASARDLDHLLRIFHERLPADLDEESLREVVRVIAYHLKYFVHSLFVDRSIEDKDTPPLLHDLSVPLFPQAERVPERFAPFARLVYQRAAEWFPEDEDYQDFFAMLSAWEGDLETARVEMRKLLAVTTNQPKIQGWLGYFEEARAGGFRTADVRTKIRASYKADPSQFEPGQRAFEGLLTRAGEGIQPVPTGPGAQHQDEDWRERFVQMLFDEVPLQREMTPLADAIAAALFERLEEARGREGSESRLEELYRSLLKDHAGDRSASGIRQFFLQLFTRSFPDWLRGKPLRVGIGYLLSNLTLYQLRKTSSPVSPDVQGVAFDAIRDWVKPHKGQGISLGRETAGIVPITFQLGGDRQITIELEVLGHDRLFNAGDGAVPGLNLPLGENRYAVILQSRLFETDPAEGVKVWKHEVAEVLLRAMGYGLEDSHRLALEHEDARLWLDGGPPAPARRSFQRTHPGAAHAEELQRLAVDLQKLLTILTSMSQAWREGPRAQGRYQTLWNAAQNTADALRPALERLGVDQDVGLLLEPLAETSMEQFPSSKEDKPLWMRRILGACAAAIVHGNPRPELTPRMVEIWEEEWKEAASLLAPRRASEIPKPRPASLRNVLPRQIQRSTERQFMELLEDIFTGQQAIIRDWPEAAAGGELGGGGPQVFLDSSLAEPDQEAALRWHAANAAAKLLARWEDRRRFSGAYGILRALLHAEKWKDDYAEFLRPTARPVREALGRLFQEARRLASDPSLPLPQLEQQIASLRERGMNVLREADVSQEGFAGADEIFAETVGETTLAGAVTGLCERIGRWDRDTIRYWFERVASPLEGTPDFVESSVALLLRADPNRASRLVKGLQQAAGALEGLLGAVSGEGRDPRRYEQRREELTRLADDLRPHLIEVGAEIQPQVIADLLGLHRDVDLQARLDRIGLENPEMLILLVANLGDAVPFTEDETRVLREEIPHAVELFVPEGDRQNVARGFTWSRPSFDLLLPSWSSELDAGKILESLLDFLDFPFFHARRDSRIILAMVSGVPLQRLQAFVPRMLANALSEEWELSRGWQAMYGLLRAFTDPTGFASVGEMLMWMDPILASCFSRIYGIGRSSEFEHAWPQSLFEEVLLDAERHVGEGGWPGLPSRAQARRYEIRSAAHAFLLQGIREQIGSLGTGRGTDWIGKVFLRLAHAPDPMSAVGEIVRRTCHAARRRFLVDFTRSFKGEETDRARFMETDFQNTLQRGDVESLWALQWLQAQLSAWAVPSSRETSSWETLIPVFEALIRTFEGVSSNPPTVGRPILWCWTAFFCLDRILRALIMVRRWDLQERVIACEGQLIDHMYRSMGGRAEEVRKTLLDEVPQTVTFDQDYRSHQLYWIGGRMSSLEELRAAREVESQAAALWDQYHDRWQGNWLHPPGGFYILGLTTLGSAWAAAGRLDPSLRRQARAVANRLQEVADVLSDSPQLGKGDAIVAGSGYWAAVDICRMACDPDNPAVPDFMRRAAEGLQNLQARFPSDYLAERFALLDLITLEWEARRAMQEDPARAPDLWKRLADRMDSPSQAQGERQETLEQMTLSLALASEFGQAEELESLERRQIVHWEGEWTRLSAADRFHTSGRLAELALWHVQNNQGNRAEDLIRRILERYFSDLPVRCAVLQAFCDHPAHQEPFLERLRHLDASTFSEPEIVNRLVEDLEQARFLARVSWLASPGRGALVGAAALAPLLWNHPGMNQAGSPVVEVAQALAEKDWTVTLENGDLLRLPLVDGREICLDAGNLKAAGQPVVIVRFDRQGFVLSLPDGTALAEISHEGEMRLSKDAPAIDRLPPLPASVRDNAFETLGEYRSLLVLAETLAETLRQGITYESIAIVRDQTDARVELNNRVIRLSLHYLRNPLAARSAVEEHLAHHDPFIRLEAHAKLVEEIEKDNRAFNFEDPDIESPPDLPAQPLADWLPSVQQTYSQLQERVQDTCHRLRVIRGIAQHLNIQGFKRESAGMTASRLQVLLSTLLRDMQNPRWEHRGRPFLFMDTRGQYQSGFEAFWSEGPSRGLVGVGLTTLRYCTDTPEGHVVFAKPRTSDATGDPGKIFVRHRDKQGALVLQLFEPETGESYDYIQVMWGNEQGRFRQDLAACAPRYAQSLNEDLDTLLVPYGTEDRRRMARHLRDILPVAVFSSSDPDWEDLNHHLLQLVFADISCAIAFSGAPAGLREAAAMTAQTRSTPAWLLYELDRLWGVFGLSREGAEQRADCLAFMNLAVMPLLESRRVSSKLASSMAYPREFFEEIRHRLQNLWALLESLQNVDGVREIAEDAARWDPRKAAEYGFGAEPTPLEHFFLRLQQRQMEALMIPAEEAPSAGVIEMSEAERRARATHLTFFGGVSDDLTGTSYGVRYEDDLFIFDAGARRNPETALPDYRYMDRHRWPRFAILSHAHEDHVGAAPWLYYERFNEEVPFYATRETKELMSIGLRSFLRHLADPRLDPDEEVAETRENTAGGPVEPRREPSDAFLRFLKGKSPEEIDHLVDRFIHSIHELEFDQDYSVSPTMKIRLHRAGHLYGAASLIVMTPDGNTFFSGDYSVQPQGPIPGFVALPEDIPIHTAVVDSTYRLQEPVTIDQEHRAFVEEAIAVFAREGKILIPAIAMGRAQTVLDFVLDVFMDPNIKIYIDGMAWAITQRHLRAFPYLRPEGKVIPVAFYAAQRGMSSAEARREIANAPGKAFIIASSGDTRFGASKEWAKLLLPDPRNAVFYVGYMEDQAPGSQLLAHARQRRGREFRFRFASREEEIDVRARIRKFGFPGHPFLMETLDVLLDMSELRQVIFVHPGGQAIVHAVRALDPPWSVKTPHARGHREMTAVVNNREWFEARFGEDGMRGDTQWLDVHRETDEGNNSLNSERSEAQQEGTPGASEKFIGSLCEAAFLALLAAFVTGHLLTGQIWSATSSVLFLLGMTAYLPSPLYALGIHHLGWRGVVWLALRGGVVARMDTPEEAFTPGRIGRALRHHEAKHRDQRDRQWRYRQVKGYGTGFLDEWEAMRAESAAGFWIAILGHITFAPNWLARSIRMWVVQRIALLQRGKPRNKGPLLAAA